MKTETLNPATALLSIREKRSILAKMLRGEWKSKRYVKRGGQLVEVEETLTAALILRIIALDERLARQEQKEAAQLRKAQSKAPAAAATEPEEDTALDHSVSAVAAAVPNSTLGAPKPLSKKQRKRMAARG